MKISWWSVLVFIMACVLVHTHPAPPQPQQSIRGMSLVPQWHCLRYRKFDLVRRCRNYRAGRRY